MARIITSLADLADRPMVDLVDSQFVYWKVVLYVTQSCFRVGNLASGPDFGRILVVEALKSALRAAFG